MDHTSWWCDFHESGNPESRTYWWLLTLVILKQDRGYLCTRRGMRSINLKVDQAVPVRKGKLWAVAEVYNLLNKPPRRLSRDTSTNRWIIQGRQDPVELMLGARYEF